MKHIFTLLLFLTTSLIFAQTTLTEYTYLTKGYKDDLETGRDIKNGYRMGFINKFTSIVTYEVSSIKNSPVRSISFYTFIREKDTTATAALFILDREDSPRPTYICIPSKNSSKEISSLAMKNFFNLAIGRDENVVTAYHYLWNALNLIADPYLNKAKGPIRKPVNNQ